MSSVLVIGSGGREHALAWKLAQSPQVSSVYVAPGNAGTAQLATNVPIDSADTAKLMAFAMEHQIDLTVIGPETPLAAGIVDAFTDAGLSVFGPTRAAARLESSKAFAKQFMRDHDIPTGDFAVFTDYEDALAYLHQQPSGVVIKASGLAAGKGVIVCDDHAAAEAALSQIMREDAFGPAGDEVLIEERLSGPEVSVLAFADGRSIVPMIPSRDHKRAFDGDQGPNTGGMGAYTSPRDVDAVLLDRIARTILEPAVRGMAALGHPYKGVLYAGVMLTKDGPKVLEFNCRFGDPETQVVLPMLKGDLFAILQACVEGKLDQQDIDWYDGECATVVMAAPGYPGSYPKGLPISGLADVPPDVVVFHAGTAEKDGQIVSDGGRVLAVTAQGEDLSAAVSRAYDAVNLIHFDGAHFRQDIGQSVARRSTENAT